MKQAQITRLADGRRQFVSPEPEYWSVRGHQRGHELRLHPASTRPQFIPLEDIPSAFTLRKSLPDLNSFRFWLEEFIARLHIECFVELVQVTDRTIRSVR